MNESNPSETLDRFSMLVRRAKMLRRLSNGSPGDINMLRDAGDAAERVVDYSTECLAQEVSKHADIAQEMFSRDMQERFDAMYGILDRHVAPGRGSIGPRRMLIERAVPYASFSPHHYGHDETDDNEEIADSLNNERNAGRLARHVLDRELGLRPRLPYSLVPPHEYFTPETAREMTDELGHLRQALRDHVRTIDPIFHDERDLIPSDVGELNNESRWLGRRLEHPTRAPVRLRPTQADRSRKRGRGDDSDDASEGTDRGEGKRPRLDPRSRKAVDRN